MKELIERLRHGYPSKERLEAADAIEKLEAERERNLQSIVDGTLAR